MLGSLYFGAKMPSCLMKFIRTREDWYPAIPAGAQRNISLNHLFNYNNPLLSSAARVHLILLDYKTDNWRVAVWGDDDFGLEHDHLKLYPALELYDSIVDFTTQNDLMAKGFNRV